MANEDVSIRNLEGPYSSHLYIGFSPDNEKTILDLREKLRRHGVICYLRAMNDGIRESIREGVATSQKCLLFLTSEYVNDEWYQMETMAVVEKSERFSHDVVIILRGTNLVVVPDRLRPFKTQSFKPLDDEQFFTKMLDTITKEPNVKLAVLPKQNIGYGSAYGYFYGFLRLVLPDFKKRLIEETLKNDPDLVAKTVQKMLIIMPESCFCATDLKSENQIEFTGKFVVRVANRAGNQKRDYKSSLYKLIDHERKQDYYFVGELATPLLTLYETHYFGLCGMTKDQLYTERDAFCFTLKAILNHTDNAWCNDQFKLLYWSDLATGKRDHLDLYKFLLPVLRTEISLERDTERNLSKVPQNRLLLNTFENVPVDGSDPSRIYNEVDEYPMNRRPRGLCVIVNIANFEKGHPHLLPRKGAEKDAECLQKLFEYLHFTVQVHTDVNALTLQSLFLAMHIADHANYDAFVCCILTHGKLGVIYTSDGKEVEILSLVDFFTDRNCPSLKGKPKMFFIQACQRGSAADMTDRDTVEDNRKGISNIEVGSSNIAVTEVERVLEVDATNDPTESHPNFRLKAVLVPGSPDILMSYSTLPESISYRDTQTGSLYVQALDKCLRKGEEIDRALKMVSSNVREKLRQRGELDRTEELFQLPFHLTSGMDRLIYL